MIKLVCILLIVAPFNTFSQREYIDTLDFKSEVLSNLISKKLNSERKKKRVDSLFQNDELRDMTLNHVQYMSKNGFVGHKQQNKETGNLEKRLEYFDGNNQFISENVMSIDLRKLIVKSKGRYGYDKLARLIYDKWKKSSFDYQQIINKKYYYINQQFIVKNGFLYICQTLASKAFIETYEYVKGEPFFIKKTKPCRNCKVVQKKINNGLGHVGWYSVSNDSIYYWNTKYYYKGKRKKNNIKLIFNKKGRIAIDVIHHEQIDCKSKTAYDRSIYHDGYYIGNVTKKSLKNSVIESSNFVQVYVGQIPAFKDTFFQVDLNYSKKMKPCMNNSIIYVNPDFFEPAEYFDFPKPIVKQANQIVIKDSLIVKVPFKRNQTNEDIEIFKPLIVALDSITKEKHIVKTIFYTGIASIEGNESSNKKLIRKRGTLIKNYLFKFYPEIEFKSQFYENFEDFRDGLRLLGYIDIAKLNDIELRKWTNKHRDEIKIAELLNSTRQSLVSISFHDEIKLENIKYTLSVKHVQDLINNNNTKSALIYFQIMGHKAIEGDIVISDSLSNLIIPQSILYKDLNWNYFIYQLNMSDKKISEADLNYLFKNGAIKNKTEFLEYRLMFNIFNNSNAINTSDFSDVVVGLSKETQLAWLQTLDLISGVQTTRYSPQMATPKIVNMVLKNKFNVYQTYFVSQYLIDWGYTMEPYLLLSKFARQKNVFPKLYKQYIKLGYFLQQFNNKREWKRIKAAMVTLSQKNSQEYCDLFKWHQMGVRALENKEVAKIFCETCR
jgi:hypothetical protein